jgi:hypothetical protein
VPRARLKAQLQVDLEGAQLVTGAAADALDSHLERLARGEALEQEMEGLCTPGVALEFCSGLDADEHRAGRGSAPLRAASGT